jgi:DNA-binding FadR family transcriptional regulator
MGNVDELIQAQVLAARAACEQITSNALKLLIDSVDRACCLPSKPGWERKAAAHAEIFRLLADVAGHPAASPLAAIDDLMRAVGPAANGIITSSHRRLLACMGAGDAEGTAREMENHLRVLHYMGLLADRNHQDHVMSAHQAEPQH